MDLSDVNPKGQLAQLSGNPVIRLQDLPLETPFKIVSGKFVKTKYGSCVLLELENAKIFLPKRMNDVLEGKVDQFATRKYSLVYEGSQECGQHKPAQKFRFIEE